MARRAGPVLAVWLGLALLVMLAQLGRRTPTVFADELIFGRLAENLGRGEGWTFQGAPSSMRTLYPYLVAPAWALFDATAAYRAALAINAVVMTSVVVPAWLLARQVAPGRWALAAAGCAAVVPAMVWSGMLMTEALAYPLATWAFVAMVRALRRPSLLSVALVVAAVAAAALVRTQLVVLLGIFVVAVAADTLRGGRAGLRDRIRHHRLVLVPAALGAVGLAVLLAVGQRFFGTYACVVADPPTPAEIGGPVLDYAGTMFVAALGVPVIAVAALALRRSAWRDERVGPLLCVAAAALLGFVAQAAWTAVTVSPELQERYIFYAAPACLACLLALPRLGSPRTVAAVVTIAVVYAVAVFPGFADVTGDVLAQRLGLPGPLADVVGSRAVLWGAIFAVLGAAAYLATRTGGERGLLIALAVTAVFGTATFAVRQLDANRASQEFAAGRPQPLDVVDRLTGGEPAGILVGPGSDAATLFHLQLWNEQADRTYRLGIPDAYGAGQLCPLQVSRGELRLDQPCAGRPLPRWLVILDQRPGLPLANGVVRYEDAGVRVVELPPGTAPRLPRVAPDAPERGDTPPPAPPRTDEPLARCTAS